MPDSAEELFGPRLTAVSTPEALFGPKDIIQSKNLGGDYYGEYFTTQEAGKILDQFGQGFKDKWGTTPLGRGSDIEKGLRDAGVLPDYDKGQASVLQRFNEDLFRQAAIGLDFAMRGSAAVAAGLLNTASPLAVIGAAGTTLFEGYLPEFHAPVVRSLQKGRDLGITDERFPGMTPNETARQSFAPRGEPSQTERVVSPPTPETPPPPTPATPTDVHGLARSIAPDTFERYDPLLEQHAALSESIDTLKEAQQRAVDEEVKAMLDKVAGVEDRLTNRQKQRLSDIRAAGEEYLGTDTPEIAALRKQRQGIDEELRDLAPDVSAAYKEARNRLTPPEDTAPVPDMVPSPAENVVPFPTENKPPAVTPAIENLAQRQRPIATEVADQLRAAGRPAEEAQKAGMLVQAHYEARAARFNGELGSARDLFDKEAPDVVSAEGKHRGQLNLAQNTITLFKNADASTFVHESAHSWLEEMLRDAEHPQAPQGLKDDLETVRAWLGAQDRPTRAQHEKFARGFERYLMEGVAPSQKLAGVFAKFKDWLTSLYQTVARLRSPINDQIRGVYDRLLAKPKDEPVIAPEREVAQNFADVHEADLARIQSGKAESADILKLADQVRAERDQIAQILTTEINNARRRARVAKSRPEGDATADAERGSVSGERAAGTGGEPVRAEPSEETIAVSPSGAGFKAKGDVPGGPNESFGASDGRLIDKAGNIRLDNLEAPDEVDEIIRGAARYNNDYTEQRRGVLTDGQVIELADALGVKPNFLDAKRVGEAFSAEEIVAARRLAVESASAVRDAFVTVDEGGDPLILAKAIARHEMIQGKVAQATAEWGRAGRAFRMLSEFNGDLEQLNQVLKENTGRSYDELMQMARLGRNLQTPKQIGKFVHDTATARLVKGIVYYYTNSLISGPFTHAAYFVGNELRSIALPASTAVQATIGATREALGLSAEDRVYFREVGAALHGLITGTKNAIPSAVDAFRAGHQIPLPGQKSYSGAWNTYAPAGTPRWVENTVGFPGKNVAMIHQFSRVVLYEQFMQRLATRQAIMEGLDGDRLNARIADLTTSPPQELMADAANRADTEMFQRRTGYNSVVGMMQRYTDQYPMTKLIFPFLKIGMEIQRETFIKHTPVGLFSSEVRNQLLAREGGAMFDEAAGKQLIGVGLLGSGAMLASQGIITGNGPSEPDQNRVWRLSHQPYSVTVGNLSFPMQGLGPIGKLLQFGADTWETQHYWDGKDGSKLAIGYAKAVERAAFDEGFFRDFVNLNSALDDPGRNAVKWFENFAAGFVPYSAALSQINRHVIDPYQKVIEPGVQGIFDAIRSRVPIASFGVQNARDIFGEPINARDIREGFRYDNDPTVKWFEQLGNVSVGRLDRTIAGVKPTPEQYDDLARIAGRLSKELLDEARPMLQGQTKGIQLKEIDRIIGVARGAARKLVMMESIGTSNDIVEKASDLKLQALQ